MDVGHLLACITLHSELCISMDAEAWMLQHGRCRTPPMMVTQPAQAPDAPFLTPAALEWYSTGLELHLVS